jgi:L-cysteine desulfidase
MIGVVATLKIQDGKQAEFEAVFTDLQKQVKANEAGCIAYQLTKSRTDATVYKVLELYADEDALIAAGFKDGDLDGSWVPYRAVGCDRCNSGYKGRVGIYQVMPISEEIQRLILAGGNAMEIAARMAAARLAK